MNTTPDNKELTNILEDLDIRITCDIGHPGGLCHTDQTPCQREADYTVNYHSCPECEALYGTVQGHGYGSWCSFHLAIYTTNVQKSIRNAEAHGKILRCLGCKHLYRSIPDALWNVTPIR